MTYKWLAIAGAFAAFVTAASAQTVDQAKVQESIKRGVDNLWEEQREDGSWAYGDSEPRALGMTALAALALYENGTLPNDPRLRKALQYVRENSLNNTDTYSVALATVILARVGQREDRSLVRSLAAKLVAGQHLTGGWGYSVPKLTADQERNAQLRKAPEAALGDLSLTQFAVLALWQAQRVGARVEDALQTSRLRLAWAQTKNGGWNYYGIPDQADSASMTTAGAFMWVVSSAWEIKEAKRKGIETIAARPPKPRPTSNKEKVRKQLATKKDVTDEQIKAAVDKAKEAKPVDIYEALQRGAETIKESANKTTNGLFKEGDEEGGIEYQYTPVLPPSLEASKPSPLAEDEPLKKALERVAFWADRSNLGAGNLYYTWSLERLGVLLGVETFGKTEWFNKGAANIIKQQREDGSWGISAEEEESTETHYKHGPDTCFALLFLRKANLGSDVTRMLNPDPVNAFTIDGRPEAYKTLADAITNVKEGESIVIKGDGPYPVSAQLIDKSITIRAAQGYDPVLKYDRPKDKYGLDVNLNEVPDGKYMLILKGKQVTLEGLRLQMDPPLGVQAEWALVKCDGADLRLLNCTLSESNQRKTTGIVMVNSPRSLMRNTMFVGFEPSISIQSGGRCNMMLKDCLSYGPASFWTAGEGEINVWLVESTFHNDSLFDSAKSKGAVNIIAENNAFRIKQFFNDLGTGERTWDGQKNLIDNRLWIAKGPGKASSIEDLEGWKKMFGTAEHRSRQTAAPFAVNRLQMGSYRHELSSQEWAIDEDKLKAAMTVGAEDQIGANVYVVGAGLGYLTFREKLDYAGWQKVQLPSERESVAGN